jgi:hypothetical protein
MSTDGTITAWGNHVDGAVTLTKLRGTDQFNNPMSLAMFRAVRTMMITSCVQRSKPVDTFPGTQGWMGTGDMSEENAANRLTLICIDLPNLRARANRLTSSPYSTTEAPEARQILEFAQLVDDNLDAWYRTLPPEWKHRIIGVEGGAISDEDLAEAEKWPGEQHVYHDIPLASIMNDYRVCRIFCRRVMLACVEWLGDGGVGVYEQSVFVVQQMVDEISACVPFHMCYDLQPVARESGQEQYGMSCVCLDASPRSLFFPNLNNPMAGLLTLESSRRSLRRVLARVAALRRRKRRNHPPAPARLAARAAVSHRDKVRAQQRAGAGAGAETRAHVRAHVSLTCVVYSIVLNVICIFPNFLKILSFAGLWSLAGV